MRIATDAKITWYHSPIDGDVLKALTTRSDGRGFAQMLTQLALTTGTGVGAYYVATHFAWPWAVLACYLHATVYAFIGLSGCGHELCHGTVFKTKFWNEFFLRLTAFLSWTNFHHFRASHNGHHRFTVHRDLDLEVVLPLPFKPSDWITVFTLNPKFIGFIFATTVRHARGGMQGEWEARIFPPEDAAGRRAVRNWARLLLGGHALLAGVFIYFHLYWLLALVTFAPFYGGWLNFLCGFTQHAGLPHSVPDFRLCCRTVLLNPVVRFLYWHMNYHVEHHMYAAVPFYNLGKLRAAIAHDLPPAYPGLIAAWRAMLPVLRRQREDPEYAFMPPLPSNAAPVSE
jgi:fatty acid desaturase